MFVDSLANTNVTPPVRLSANTLGAIQNLNARDEAFWTSMGSGPNARYNNNSTFEPIDGVLVFENGQFPGDPVFTLGSSTTNGGARGIFEVNGSTYLIVGVRPNYGTTSEIESLLVEEINHTTEYAYLITERYTSQIAASLSVTSPNGLRAIEHLVNDIVVDQITAAGFGVQTNTLGITSLSFIQQQLHQYNQNHQNIGLQTLTQAELTSISLFLWNNPAGLVNARYSGALGGAYVGIPNDIELSFESDFFDDILSGVGRFLGSALSELRSTVFDMFPGAYETYLAQQMVGTPEQISFQNQFIAAQGGWTPPPGAHVVAYGGGMRLVDAKNLPYQFGGNEDRLSDRERDRLDKEKARDQAEDRAGQDSGGAKTKPIILDLDGLGISVTELSQSTIFVDGGDGLEHRTAWAGAGDGVLFFDADGSGDISEQREYVFTEWDPTATSDLEALRSVFDTNGDGKLTNADTTWSQFQVARTEPDGTLSYHTLDALGITEIDLMGDATNIELPDGSVITEFRDSVVVLEASR